MGRTFHRPHSLPGAGVKFTPLPLSGAYLIDIDPHGDERGFFARTVCREEFAEHGLTADFVQQSVSYNNRRGILRGLHCQIAPYQEEKLVRATQGAIFDVIVDLRRDSPTYRRWHAETLSADNRKALYIPQGLAHGFQTLTDSAEVFYQMSVPYQPQAARAVHWQDPAFGIQWPAPDQAILSPQDSKAPLLAHLENEFPA